MKSLFAYCKPWLVGFVLVFHFPNLFAQNTYMRVIGDAGLDYARSFTTTSDGYVIVGEKQVSGGNGLDALIIKLDLNGELQWSRTSGFGGYDNVHTVMEIDSFYVAAGRTVSGGANDRDHFIWKIDRQGNTLDSWYFGGNAFDFTRVVLPDGKGNILGMGPTASNFGAGGQDANVYRMDLNGNLLDNFAFGKSGTEFFHDIIPTADCGWIMAGYDQSNSLVVKLDSSLAWQWSKIYYFSGTNSIFMAITELQDGNFVVTGRVSFGPIGGTDAILMKLDPAGNKIWLKSYGGTGDEWAVDVEERPNGDLVLLAETSSTPGGDQDICLMRTSQNGTILWAKTYGGSDDDYVQNYTNILDQHPDGGFVFLGHTYSFGSGDRDIIFIKTDSAGNVGCHENTITFSEDTISLTISGTNFATGSDAAVTATSHFGVPLSLTPLTLCIDTFQCFDTLSIEACDSFFYPGNQTTYYTSTPFNDTLAGSAGCDSILTFQLTVHYTNLVADTLMACDTIVVGGLMYYSDTLLFDTLPNQFGCDSIVALSLVFGPPSTDSLFIATCGSYTTPSGNATYSNSGIYLDTLTDGNGCDSILVIDLKVHKAIDMFDTVTACDSFSIGKHTYTTSGFYIDSLVSSEGCDSVLHTLLTIVHSTSSTSDLSACKSYTVPSGKATYTTNGVYRDTIPNARGCDSILTINLAVLHPDTSVGSFSNTLSAQATGAQYQWLDCNKGMAAIAGATGQSYIANTSGYYAVVVTKNGCSDTSGCHPVYALGIAGIGERGEVQLYPNPASNVFGVSLPATSRNAVVMLYAVNGKEVKTVSVNSNQVQVDLSALPSGMYFVNVRYDGGVYWGKLVKE